MTARSAPLNSSSTWDSSEPFGRTRESTEGLSSAGFVSGGCAGAQALQRPRGVECGQNRLASLVLGGFREPGAVQRLLLSVTGQDAVAHRRMCVERHPSEPSGDRITDVLEVRRAAADDDAEGDDG